MAEVGRVIAERYVLERVAGSGGMGTVYCALDRTTGTQVALKLLRAGLGDPVRFAREAAALAKVSHPGVVKYVDHGTTADDEPYLVMEWLEGHDVERRLQRGPLTVDECRQLARRLAGVLAALHDLGIVHRDIKPGNLFLEAGELERLKVLDLGIARVRSGSAAGTGKTGTGAILGTPAYMAPEQARGESNVDARADLFATGCVLYECLAGRPPFVGDGPMAVLAKVLLEHPPPLRELRPDAPRALANLVARVMAKDAAERPANGRALLAALEAAERDELHERDTPLPAISGAELRVVSVVLAAPVEATAATVAAPRTDPIAAATTQPSEAELRASHAASATGAQIARLANGAMIAAYSSAGSPKDLAQRAAACANEWCAALDGRAVAVSTGRAALVARLPVGDAIDRAAALVRGVHDARVVVDATTAALLEDSFELRREGEHSVIVGPRDAEPIRELLGKPMPCVGRDRELALLSSIFDEAVAEAAPRGALVIAPAGTGKTRLVHELVRSVKMRHPEVVVATARLDALTAGSPYALASRLVRQLAKTDAVVAPAERFRALETTLARRLPGGARRATGFLAELVGADAGAAVDPAVVAARRDPGLMADGIRDALLDWLRAECARAPHVLVIEDLHWGDAPSVRLVDAILDRLDDSPLFVLASARPEVATAFPSLWSDRGVQEIRLGTLNRRACARMIRGALPECGDELVDSLARRTGGHPFFLEELIRAVAAGAAPEVLPDSVLGMLQTRLDALGDDAKRVLRAASVFGQLFREEGVRALVPDHVGAGVVLEQLVAKEIIERASHGTDARGASFAFRHALVRDAAYATLPDSDRARAHALAGHWLEHGDDTEPAALADHFVRGGVADRAVHWLARTAEQALAAGDFPGCLAAIERARTLGPDRTAAARLDLIAAEATYWSDGPVAATPLAQRAYAEQELATAAWFRAANLLVTSAGQRGDNELVDQIGRRAAEATVDAAERPALAGLLARTCDQLVWTGRDVAHHVAKLDEIAPDPSAFDPWLAGIIQRARGTIGLFNLDVGCCANQLAAAKASFARANARNEERMAHAYRHVLLSMCGNAQSNDVLAELVGKLEPGDTSYPASYERFQLTLALAVWKRTDEVLALADDVVVRVAGSARFEFLIRLSRALALCCARRHDEAIAESERANAIPVRGPIRARTVAIAALALLELGRIADADAAARRAIELTGGRWELYDGLVELAAGRVWRAMGDVDAARAVIAAPIARLGKLARTVPPGHGNAWDLPLPNVELRELARELGVGL